MTLTGRVSLFFLAALAVTLAGFSLGLWLLVADYLDRHLDQQLDATLLALTAALDIKRDGVEWEPSERHLPTGEEVRWAVRDPRGRDIGHSPDRLLDSEESWRRQQRRIA